MRESAQDASLVHGSPFSPLPSVCVVTERTAECFRWMLTWIVPLDRRALTVLICSFAYKDEGLSSKANKIVTMVAEDTIFRIRTWSCFTFLWILLNMRYDRHVKAQDEKTEGDTLLLYTYSCYTLIDISRSFSVHLIYLSSCDVMLFRNKFLWHQQLNKLFALIVSAIIQKHQVLVMGWWFIIGWTNYRIFC